MRRWLVLAVCPAVLLVGRAAYPCGAAFGPNVSVDPRQDIIVVWKDNVETYAFQPVFCGSSTDFGLILPVPSALAQAPALAEQQAFTTAAALSEPTKRQVTTHTGGCMAGSSLAAGSRNADNGSATVVASGRVGFLDWVQLKADSESDFTEWLTNNGYPYSSTSTSVFSYYVQKGWYFVAFRINQAEVPPGQTICRALGPIRLAFATPEPVIPSRMAGAGGQPSGPSRRFAWRIFGITPGEAELAFADGVSADRVRWFSGAIGAADAPSFAGLAEAGDRLARLALTFDGYESPSATEDVRLTLATAQDYRGTEDVYVEDQSACSVGGNARSSQLAWVLSGLTLAAFLGWRRRR